MTHSNALQLGGWQHTERDNPRVPPGYPRGHPPGLLLKGKHPQDPHEFALEYTGTRTMYSACKAKQDATAEKLRVH